MNKQKKNHGQDPKRLFIAVLILIAVIFMLVGPRAKAEIPEINAATQLVQHNVPMVTLLKAAIGF